MALEDYKPAIVMLLLQCIYATIILCSKTVFLKGLSPTIFVVYRLTFATLIITPIALLKRMRTSSNPRLGWKTFWLIFLTSIVGGTLNMNFYFVGLRLSSSSIASAMSNIIPALTFLIAYFLGYEKVSIRRLGSLAKIFGTVVCVSGAVVMTLAKGPKLLNKEFLVSISRMFSDTTENDYMWLLGCLSLFASVTCFSIWLILQVPVTVRYPDPLYFTTWMCLISTIQTTIVAYFLESNFDAWKLQSHVELSGCVISGLGTVLAFIGQAWCISRRGPLFSAMFSPLQTLIVTILAPFFFDEKIYLGGLVGAVFVIFGLYIVLWGKAKDVQEINEEFEVKNSSGKTKFMDEESSTTSYITDLEQPLIINNSAIK